MKSGYTGGDPIPQLSFRAGGPHTVRGYEYGARVGLGMWAAQLDVALSSSWVLAPVARIDVGDVSTSTGPTDSATRSSGLASACRR